MDPGDATKRRRSDLEPGPLSPRQQAQVWHQGRAERWRGPRWTRFASGIPWQGSGRPPAFAQDPGRLVDHVLARVRWGSVILPHLETSTRAPGRAALPRLIGALRAAGYEFVTVSQLMRGAPPS